MTYTRLTYGTTRAKPTQCHTVCGKPIQKLPLKLDIGKTCLHELLSAATNPSRNTDSKLSATGRRSTSADSLLTYRQQLVLARVLTTYTPIDNWSLCDCCLHAQLSATGPCKSASTVHAVDSINMFS